jgi:LAO/AO transport system kinase
VLATSAVTGEGVHELWRAVREHRAHLTATGELEGRRADRVGGELVRIVAALLQERAQAAGGAQLDDLAVAVARRTIDPWSAAEQLLQE